MHLIVIAFANINYRHNYHNNNNIGQKLMAIETIYMQYPANWFTL